MFEIVFLAQLTLNGLSFGALLFLLASGLTLVFGLMRIINLAHGSFYMLGGYLGVVVAGLTGNLILAVITGMAVVAVTAFFVEFVLLRFVRGQELPEVLLTVGVSFVIADLSLAIFGGDPQTLPADARIQGALSIGELTYPWYRIFVIGVAIAIGIALALVQTRTRIGAIVRAGVDDREIISAMGVNIRWVFTGMFVVGAALAALGGTIGSGVISVRPGIQDEVLLYALVVVIIGGLGSVAGAAVGSVLIGLIDAFAKAFIPELAYFTIFAPMALVLVLRPTGLFGEVRVNRSKVINVGLLVAGLALLVALPYLGTSSYVISLATTVLAVGMLAASLNFLIGDAGMASLGHGGIAAASAYGAGWASRQGMDQGSQVLIALGVTLVVSLIYGLLSMRTSGIYFLMVTLALGMVIYGLAFRLSQITGGENGITGIRRPEFLGEYWTYYYFVLAAFVLATALLWVVSRSPFGASLRGIRDSESRMRSLGYNVPAYRLGAFMISGFVAGTAGLLTVWHTHFVSPSAAGVHRSVLLIVMVILGGVGTMLGPVIGAAIVVLVENVVSNSVERWPTVLGLVFILVILFARAGIVGSAAKLFARARRSGPPESPPDDRGSPRGTPVSSGSHIK